MWKRTVRVSMLAVALPVVFANCAAPGANAVAGDTGSPGVPDLPQVVAAAPGRVEGVGETVSLGFGIEGVIQEVRVSAGDRVTAGEILASLDREDLVHAERAATAALERARGHRQRVLRGARDEARRFAAREADVAAAILVEAESRFRRVNGLFRASAVAAAERETAKRDLDAASARLQAARETQLLANQEPLPEEVRQVDADVAEAEARLDIARARKIQTRIVAPLNGTVLKVHARTGEVVSPLYPGPVVTIADLSALHVRAELDERDIPEVTLTQRARIDVGEHSVADGIVTWLSPIMRTKQSTSRDPAERADRDVREVVVRLAGSASLIVDQRVTVKFLSMDTSSR